MGVTHSDQLSYWFLDCWLSIYERNELTQCPLAVTRFSIILSTAQQSYWSSGCWWVMEGWVNPGNTCWSLYSILLFHCPTALLIQWLLVGIWVKPVQVGTCFLCYSSLANSCIDPATVGHWLFPSSLLAHRECWTLAFSNSPFKWSGLLGFWLFPSCWGFKWKSAHAHIDWWV